MTASNAAIGAPAPMDIMEQPIKQNTTKLPPCNPRLVLSQINPPPIPPVTKSLEKIPITMNIRISRAFPYWPSPLTTEHQNSRLFLQKINPVKIDKTAASIKTFME